MPPLRSVPKKHSCLRSTPQATMLKESPEATIQRHKYFVRLSVATAFEGGIDNYWMSVTESAAAGVRRQRPRCTADINPDRLTSSNGLFPACQRSRKLPFTLEVAQATTDCLVSATPSACCDRQQRPRSGPRDCRSNLSMDRPFNFRTRKFATHLASTGQSKFLKTHNLPKLKVLTVNTFIKSTT
mgnify:CR=1 FL=1